MNNPKSKELIASMRVKSSSLPPWGGAFPSHSSRALSHGSETFPYTCSAKYGRRCTDIYAATTPHGCRSTYWVA